MVRRNVRMRTAYDLALLQPLLANGPKNSQRPHGLSWVEDVVNDALEVESVVSVGHQFWRIRAGHVECMREFLVIVCMAEHLEEAFLVANIFELWVRSCHVSIIDELYHPRLREAVEISTQQELNSLGPFLMPWTEAVTKIFHNLPQLLHQHHGLDQLHIAELRVPVNVS